MIKKLLLLILLFVRPIAGLPQQTTKIYFIQKLTSKNSFAYSDTARFKSAGAEVYQSIRGKKIDSLFIKADELLQWRDSVSFSLAVPNNFFSVGSMISISPFLYLGSKTKGGISGYLQEKEQSIVQIKVKIKSDPSGAEVYLIPKLYWERNHQLAKYNLQALNPYRVNQGLTPVTTIVQEYVYITVFAYKKKFVISQFEPNHLNPMDSIYRKLN
ncbi:hypothetical protein SAMN05192574_108272 [Mucilaginibacter gossypiicola]|uniref:GLPGLI family protein n=1 Tax=Mucilaginibacter gossypiicola TaxID=551995 RepID=A0A1H8Q5L6_9SPHI|nr:hypothetical protein [Mucilaginibacter gossypiicola]SEO49043.1 hypothetical protein SAMN05192574_108272 [Mucilaginibacter gossypiicola]